MGGAICTNNPGSVQNECDRQILDADVVNQLVVSTLQKCAVNGHDGLEPLTCHSPRQGDGVLLGNADIDVLRRNGFLEQVKTCAGGHGSSNTNHGGVLLAELDQRLAKHLAVTGRLWCFAGSSLAGGQIKG